MIARTTVLQAESRAPVEQLTGPAASGAHPVKSAWIQSSPTVAVTTMGSSSSETPSPSMTSSAR